jgi:fibronectin-binding autotransporter adhesin
VSSGTLLNSASGVIRSKGTGPSANTLNAQVTNQGLIDVQQNLSVSNSGRVFDISAGTLNIATGKVFSVSEGTTRVGGGTVFGTGTGTVAVSGGTLDVVSDVTVGAGAATLSLASTTVNGAGTLTNQGTLRLANDTINVAVSNTSTGIVDVLGSNTVSAGLSNAGTLTVEPNSSLTLSGTSNNAAAGTINVWANDGAGGVGFSTLTVGGAMTNAGTIELRGDSITGFSATLNLESATLANSGLIHSTLAGTGTSSSPNTMNLNGTGSVLTNTGTVRVDQSLTLGGAMDNQGLLAVSSGSTLYVNNVSTFNNPTTGTIVGGGTIDLASGTGTLINSGTVAPSGGITTPQTLTIRGNFSQGATGNLAVNISGASTGQYDQLAVTGTATLGGTLTAILGFVPSGNPQFQIVTASSGITGNFSSYNLPAGFGHQVNPTSIVLTFGGTSCAGTICWDNTSGNGLWTDPLNWNLDALPGLNDVVVIDLGGGTFVVLDSGTHTIASLLAGENLQITGGSLSVTGSSTFNGGLTVSGGAFTGNGAISANLVNLSSGSLNVASTALINALNMSGGVVSGVGALIVVPGTFVWTGGTIAVGTSVTTSGPGSISAGVAKTLSGTLTNSGTLNLSDNLVGSGLLQNSNQMSMGAVSIQTAVANSGLINILASTGTTFGGTLSNSASGTVSVTTNSTTNASLVVTGNVTNDGNISLVAAGGGGGSAGFGVTTGTLTNSGTIVSSGNAPLFNRLSGNLVNNGTLDLVDSLRMDNEGYFFTQSGVVSIASGKQLFINGNVAGTTLNLNSDLTIGSGATVRLGRVAVNGPAGISNLGTLNSGNAAIATSVANNPGGLIEVRGLGNSISTLANAGTVSVIGDVSGLARLDVGSGFTNSGIIELVSASGANGAGFGVTSGTLVNASTGVLRSRSIGGLGDNGFDAAITNLGAIDAAYSMKIANAGKIFDSKAGALSVGGGQTLDVNQGTAIFGTGTNISGLGGSITLSSGTLNLVSDMTFVANGATLDFRTETVTGPGQLINSGNLNVFGTNNLINTTLDNLGEFVVQPGASVVLSAPSINETGGVIIVTANNGSGVTSFSSMTVASTLINAGDLEIRSDASNGLNASLIISGTGTVNNSGIIHSMLTGTGTSNPTSFINPGGTNGTLVNTGMIQADSPTTVSLSTLDTSAGTLSVSSGQTISLAGTGTVIMGGATNFVGDGTGRVDLSDAGTLRLSSSMTLPTLASVTFSGNVAITSAGPATLTNAGTLNLANDSLGTSLTLLNAGALTLDATGGAGNLNNQGTIDAFNASTLGSLTQSASGVLRLHGTTSAASLTVTNPVDNFGLIELDAQANGATLSALAGLTNEPSTGVIGGIGTFVVGSGAAGLTNAGTIRAGMSPGTLNINGDLVLDGVNGSITEIELGGLTAGTQYDVINVSGQVRGTGALNDNWGTLNVLHFGGFSSSAGNVFTVMNYGSRLGDFTVKAYPVGVNYIAVPGTTSYTLTPYSLADIWIGSTGLWSDGFNWSLGRAPIAGEDALIDVPGLQTVTMPAGTTASLASLTVNGEVLTVLNSTLGIGSFANFDVTSVVNITNSTLNGSGLITNQGVMNLNTASIANPIHNMGTISAASLNNLTGALTTAAGSILRILPGGTADFTDAFVNNGLIELQRAGTSVAELIVESETTLVNAGTIESTGAGSGFNALHFKNNRVVGNVDVSMQNLAGALVRADADLLINHFDGTVDATSGTLDAASGQTLRFANYSSSTGTNVKLGPAAAFGAGTGTIDVYNGIAQLTGDLTLPGGGPQFSFRGPSIDGAGFTLTNDGLLTLNGISINVAVVNNGRLVADGPRTAGFRNFVTLNNPLTMGAGSTIQIDGGAAIATAAGFTNAGTIELNSAVAGTPFDGATLTVSTGTLTNAGLILSQTAGGTQFNSISAPITMTNTGLIDVEHDLSLSGILAIPSVVTGVAVTGPGNLTLNNTFTWAGGIVSGPGTLTTTSASSVTNASTLLDGRDWSNTGTLTLNGQLHLGNGAVLTNASTGTVNLSASSNNAPIKQGGGTLAAFVNVGTLNKTTSAGHTIDTRFDNSGTVSVTAGELDFAGGGNHVGQFNAGGAGTVIGFTGGVHVFDAGASFTGAGEMSIHPVLPATTVEAQFLGAFSTVSDFRVFGSSAITGTGSLSLGGSNTFFGGGTTSLAGGLTTSGSAVTVNNAPVFDGTNWSNQGAITVNGRIILDNAAVLTNETGGSLTLAGASNNTPIFAGLGGGTFDNQGLLTKNGAIPQAITTAFNNSGSVVVNDGTLQLAQSGVHTGSFDVTLAGATLDFTGGTHTLNAGTSFSGPGTVRVAGGTVDVNATPANATNFAITAGTQTGAGTLSVSDSFSFTGGVMTGTGLTVLGPTVIFAPTNLTLDRNLQVEGTLNHSGGTLSVNATKTLDVTGAMNLSGGTLDGAGNIVVDGLLGWSGGTIMGSGAFTANGVTTLDGAGKILDGRTFDANGAVNWNGTGLLTLNNGATFNSNAAMTVGGDFVIFDGGTGANAFNNAGTFTKSGGALLSRITTPFSNSGSVVVNAGSLRLENGGTDSGSYDVASGQLIFRNGTRSIAGAVGGSGDISFESGTVDFDGNYALSGNTTVSGGTVNFNNSSSTGSLAVSSGNLGGMGDFTVAGAFDWTGGMVSGTGSFSAASGQFGGGLKQLDGRTMTINGSLNFGGVDWLDMSNGAVLTVNGLASLDTSAINTSFFGINSVSGAASTVNFLGGITKLGAQPFDLAVQANTAGTVRSQVGQLAFDAGFTGAGGGTHTNTSFVANAGAEISFSRGTHVVNGGVSFGGAGQTHIGANGTAAQFVAGTSGTLTNSGLLLIDSGATLGVDLTNAGTLTLGNSTVSGNLNNPGTINVSSGTTNLSGSLSSTGAGSVVNVNGGTLGGAGNVTASVLNLSAGALNGTGDLTVTDNFTQTVGTTVGTYHNLSLQHIGDFAVRNYSATGSLTLTAAGGSLLINDVSLVAQAVSLTGNNVILQPTTSAGSLVDGSNLSVTTPGTLLLDGINGQVKLRASGTVNIKAGSVTVRAGNFPASIDPTVLNLTATGDLVIQGGTASSASAMVAGDNLNVSSLDIIIRGGSNTGSYAGILGGTSTSTSASTVTAVNNITLAPGAGVDADAFIGARGGTLTVKASGCVGCTMLTSDPRGGSQAADGGLFGIPVTLILPPTSEGTLESLIQIRNSIIYATTLATSGGEANTSYSGDAEEGEKVTEKEKDKNTDVKEEGRNDGKPKRNPPMCI